MKTFSANEVVAQVEGLHTAKTLNRWRKAVEENFGIRYFRHSHMKNVPSVISYSVDEVKRFQLVALILSEQPSNRRSLQQAIVTAFSSEPLYIKPKTCLETLEDRLNDRIDDLAMEGKNLLVSIQEINQKIAVLERRLPVEKESKSKLFRRK